MLSFGVCTRPDGGRPESVHGSLYFRCLYRPHRRTRQRPPRPRGPTHTPAVSSAATGASPTLVSPGRTFIRWFWRSAVCRALRPWPPPVPPPAVALLAALLSGDNSRAWRAGHYYDPELPANVGLWLAWPPTAREDDRAGHRATCEVHHGDAVYRSNSVEASTRYYQVQFPQDFAPDAGGIADGEYHADWACDAFDGLFIDDTDIEFPPPRHDFTVENGVVQP